MKIIYLILFIYSNSSSSADLIKITDLKLCEKIGKAVRSKNKSNLKDLILETNKRNLIYVSQQTDLTKKSFNLGATECEVYAAIGSPERQSRSVGSYGEHKQLIYGSSYIYIENGLVTSWSD